MTPHVGAQVNALRALAECRPCMFCGETANSSALFIPNNPTEYGAKPGQWRLFVYPICQGCWRATTPEQRDDLFEDERRAT